MTSTYLYSILQDRSRWGLGNHMGCHDLNPYQPLKGKDLTHCTVLRWYPLNSHFFAKESSATTTHWNSVNEAS